jgi:hypothetical protein
MGVTRVFLASIEEVIYGQLRMRHSYNLGNANIIVRDVEGQRLIEPRVIIQSSGGKKATTFSAQEAELRLLPKDGKLMLELDNLEFDGPSFTYIDSDSIPIQVSLTSHLRRFAPPRRNRRSWSVALSKA